MDHCTTDGIVDKKAKRKKHLNDIKRLFNFSTFIFFSIIFSGGLLWGLVDSYANIYLVNELNATSKMIGYSITISVAVSLPVYPFIKTIAEKIGHVHVIFWCLMLNVAKTVVFVSIK